MMRTCLSGRMTVVLCLGVGFVACSSSESARDATPTSGFSNDGGTALGSEDALLADGSTESGGDLTSADSEADSDEGEDASVGGAGGASQELDVLEPPEPQLPPAGQLTAGIFDDNLSFSFFEQYRERVLRDHQSGVVPLDWTEHTNANDSYAAAQSARTHLDITLMIDTTGSMGDELSYLQSEFIAISDAIASAYPSTDQRWGLVVYRDYGDEYVTRSTDFQSDLQSFQEVLAQQQYGGGGDFPEAPEKALAKVNQLDWRTDQDVARMVFWVADAPHHPADGQAMAEAIRGSRDQNLHVYPIASSGVDEVTEFSMRAAAQLTHGRYLFLTDDSGIGNSHKEPTLPCYYVTLLKDTMLRAVGAEMTGEVTEPHEQELIRLGGRLYENGYCAYGDGDEAQPF